MLESTFGGFKMAEAPKLEGTFGAFKMSEILNPPPQVNQGQGTFGGFNMQEALPRQDLDKKSSFQISSFSGFKMGE